MKLMRNFISIWCVHIVRAIEPVDEPSTEIGLMRDSTSWRNVSSNGQVARSKSSLSFASTTYNSIDVISIQSHFHHTATVLTSPERIESISSTSQAELSYQPRTSQQSSGISRQSLHWSNPTSYPTASYEPRQSSDKVSSDSSSADTPNAPELTAFETPRVQLSKLSSEQSSSLFSHYSSTSYEEDGSSDSPQSLTPLQGESSDIKYSSTSLSSSKASISQSEIDTTTRFTSSESSISLYEQLGFTSSAQVEQSFESARPLSVVPTLILSVDSTTVLVESTVSFPSSSTTGTNSEVWQSNTFETSSKMEEHTAQPTDLLISNRGFFSTNFGTSGSLNTISSLTGLSTGTLQTFPEFTSVTSPSQSSLPDDSTMREHSDLSSSQPKSQILTYLSQKGSPSPTLTIPSVDSTPTVVPYADHYSSTQYASVIESPSTFYPTPIITTQTHQVVTDTSSGADIEATSVRVSSRPVTTTQQSVNEILTVSFETGSSVCHSCSIARSEKMSLSILSSERLIQNGPLGSSTSPTILFNSLGMPDTLASMTPTAISKPQSTRGVHTASSPYPTSIVDNLQTAYVSTDVVSAKISGQPQRTTDILTSIFGSPKTPSPQIDTASMNSLGKAPFSAEIAASSSTHIPPRFTSTGDMSPRPLDTVPTGVGKDSVTYSESYYTTMQQSSPTISSEVNIQSSMAPTSNPGGPGLYISSFTGSRVGVSEYSTQPTGPSSNPALNGIGITPYGLSYSQDTTSEPKMSSFSQITNFPLTSHTPVSLETGPSLLETTLSYSSSSVFVVGGISAGSSSSWEPISSPSVLTTVSLDSPIADTSQAIVQTTIELLSTRGLSTYTSAAPVMTTLDLFSSDLMSVTSYAEVLTQETIGTPGHVSSTESFAPAITTISLSSPNSEPQSSPAPAQVTFSASLEEPTSRASAQTTLEFDTYTQLESSSQAPVLTSIDITRMASSSVADVGMTLVLDTTYAKTAVSVLDTISVQPLISQTVTSATLPVYSTIAYPDMTQATMTPLATGLKSYSTATLAVISRPTSLLMSRQSTLYRSDTSYSVNPALVVSSTSAEPYSQPNESPDLMSTTRAETSPTPLNPPQSVVAPYASQEHTIPPTRQSFGTMGTPQSSLYSTNIGKSSDSSHSLPPNSPVVSSVTPASPVITSLETPATSNGLTSVSLSSNPISGSVTYTPLAPDVATLSSTRSSFALSSATSEANDSNWLPSSLITATDSDSTPTLTKERGEITTSTIYPSPVTSPLSLPNAIAPSSTLGNKKNENLVQIGFRYPLNYPFVASHPVAAAQIFQYMPIAIANALQVDESQVQMRELIPWVPRNSNYLMTVAHIYIPSSDTIELQSKIRDKSSSLYHNSDAAVNELTSLIDPAVCLTCNYKGDTGYSGSDSDDGDNNSSNNQASAGGPGSLDQSRQPDMKQSKASGTAAGIAVGVVGGAIIAGGLLFWLGQALRKRSTRHLRLTDVSDHDTQSYHDLSGSERSAAAATGHSHDNDPVRYLPRRTDNAGLSISRPVVTENSLGW